MLTRAQEKDHRIVLHGALKKYGPIITMNASSPAQAVRGIVLQLPDFAKDLEQGCFRVVLGRSVKSGYEFEEKDFEKGGAFLWALNQESTLHIIPVPQGAKNGGIGKAIVGAIIMVAAIVLSYGAATPAAAGAAGAAAGGTAAAGAGSGFALSATAFTVLGTSVTYGSVALFGAALMFSGIAMMTAPSMTSNYSDRESPDQRASFFFNGPVNVSQQGGPLPLVYGRCRCGSVVISSGLEMRAM